MAKSFYAFLQFTRYIRPGSRILALDDRSALAAVSPDGRSVAVVVCNEGNEARPFTLDVSRVAGHARSASIWRTKDDDDRGEWNCRKMPDLALENDRAEDSLPPRSITTYVVRIARARSGDP